MVEDYLSQEGAWDGHHDIKPDAPKEEDILKIKDYEGRGYSILIKSDVEC